MAVRMGAGVPACTRKQRTDGASSGQRTTSAPSRPRTAWTAATPRSRPSSATAEAAASTPASPRCPGASSRCRGQVSRFQGHGVLGGAAGVPAGPQEVTRPLGPARAVPCRPLCERFVRNPNAIVSQRRAKSGYCVGSTRLERQRIRGSDSWADPPGDTQQVSHHRW